MILVLKKPYNPGDADPGKIYTHFHLELMLYNSSAYVVPLSYAYGSLDEDQQFVPGKATSLSSITVQGEELDGLSTEPASPPEPAQAAPAAEPEPAPEPSAEGEPAAS